MPKFQFQGRRFQARNVGIAAILAFAVGAPVSAGCSSSDSPVSESADASDDANSGDANPGDASPGDASSRDANDAAKEDAGGDAAIACTSTEGLCKGVCTDLTTTANCGGCGNACVDNQTCTAGVCTCPNNGNLCDGVCTDLTTLQNCGLCGNACNVDALSCTNATCVMPKVVQISAGEANTCALFDSGKVYCWGDNKYGEVGDGTTIQRRAPAQVNGLTDAVEVSVGTFFVCARKQNGHVVCWGDNSHGTLGNGTTASTAVPVEVANLTDVVEIEAGSYSACARKSDKTVFCWGDDTFGELGDGVTIVRTNNQLVTSRTTPVQVTGLNDAEGITMGQLYACARKTDGSVVCWGQNTYGNLGNGKVNIDYWDVSQDSSIPVAVNDLTDVAEVSANGRTTCARKKSGSVFCWGYSSGGQVGAGGGFGSGTQIGDFDAGFEYVYLVPTAVDGLTDAALLADSSSALYARSMCAQRTTGEFVCWGANIWSNAALDGYNFYSPSVVAIVPSTAQLAVGYQHLCELKNDGSVLCWGPSNYYGQFGDGTMITNSATPLAVTF